jgi:DNA-binding NtrC family response regulator
VRVLVTLADIEPAVRLNALLEASGIETEVVSPVDDMRAAVRRFRPDVIVITGALLDPSVLHLVREQLWEGTGIVGFADVEDAATRERLRAAGYSEVFGKPVRPEEAFDGVRRILERQRLARETGLIGETPPIQEVLVRVEQIAPVSSTVLVEGESGTGKELVARAIHQLSPRRTRPFIAVNVGALPETLLESELFGHEKGAFTGAAERRLGRFELADDGTLFLDEIGELPLSTQVKLLRVIEDGEVTRVGGTTPMRVNVRVIAATNRRLREAVEEGSFRADLYYRLNVLNVYLPPLRARRDDIPLLVRRFIAEFSARHDRPFHGISPEAMQLLVEYSWPGNVRELRNLVESMVVLAPGREIGPEDIPPEIRSGGLILPRNLPVPVSGPGSGGSASGRELEFIVRSLVELKLQMEELRRRVDERVVQMPSGWVGELHAGQGFGAPTLPGAGMTNASPPWGMPAVAAGAGPAVATVPGIAPRDQPPPPNVLTVTPGMTMAEIERGAIEAALRETRGNRRKAAELLGIGERTLYRKLREYQFGEDGGGGDDA